MIDGLGYYCDDHRHVVCVPYSIENLHRMAEDLGIKRCWYHPSKSGAHYDMPVRRIVEITTKCILVSQRDILDIVKGASKYSGSPEASGVVA